MGNTFLKTNPHHSASTVSLFGPSAGAYNHYFRHFASSYRSFLRSVRVFSLRELIKSRTFACDMCIFNMQNPIGRNDCMHRTCHHVNFACHQLFFVVPLKLCPPSLIASSVLLAKWFPPSVGSAISKVVFMRNRQKDPFKALRTSGLGSLFRNFVYSFFCGI